MNEHACFLGHVESREELADMYANSDVFVHPNPREPARYSTRYGPDIAMCCANRCFFPIRRALLDRSRTTPSRSWLGIGYRAAHVSKRAMCNHPRSANI
jgi:hypothetical protein